MSVELLADNLGFAFSVDAVLSERHEMVSRVSQFPVEDGGTIADHILNEPRRVSIEGFVTDSPLIQLPIPGGAVALDALEDVAGESFAVGIKATDSAFRLLEALRDDRVPVALITGLKRYESMVMSSLNIPRDDRTGHALRFSADFVEVQIVSIQQVTIPADQLQPGKPTQQGAGEVNTGKQVPKSVSDSEIKSIAKQIAEDVKELVGGFLQ